MSRRRDDDEPPEPQIILRPASPRHEVTEARGLTSRAAPAGDQEGDARLITILTSLGRVQLSLDIVLRRLDRLDERIASIEGAMNITDVSIRSPVSAKVRAGGPGDETPQALV